MSRVPQARAKEIALERGWPVRRETPDGNIIELHAIYNGQPYYYKTHNRRAALTVSTYECWPIGLSGLDLTGAGITLGVWDGGGVRTTHVEFGGRAVQQDSVTEDVNHATHVAGTMVAAGIRTTATGMSFEANLNCFDWNNDTSEMRREAASGLRVSNHSYGALAGWNWDYDCTKASSDGRWWWLGDVTISDVEDYKFGFYGHDAAEWDEIACDYPYYLFCGSAGNDRDEGPGTSVRHCFYDQNGNIGDTTAFRNDDGWDRSGFDTIAGAAVGKNGIAVGAVDDIAGGYESPADAKMTTFSCWGPTDDGRIKPDIVGNGFALISTLADADDSYATAFDGYSGTSMSSPNVAGSLGLLIEHWRNTHIGLEDMLSSTLKALILHTANECGTSNGPDYRYGWGLLSTRKAADVISEDIIQPGTISEHYVSAGSPVTIILTTNNIATELRATICWTDTPGEVQPPALDPTTRMLVNDLDMTMISGTSGQVYYPWVLDPSNPSAPATTGDNNLDNVEQIVIMTPGVDTWQLTVAADGPLANGFQRFSLIVTGASSIVVDCNGNGEMDHIDVSNGTSADCNSNQIPDECEFAAIGAAGDCNDDGILDECQIGAHDCNLNGILDECDIADAVSEDCNDNGEPDDCELDTPLAQSPNGENGYFADADCDICQANGMSLQQTAAENFKLLAPKTINSIVIWGAYAPDEPLEEDLFTVRFLEDDNNLLGAVVATRSNVEYSRSETGTLLFGFREHMFTLMMDPPVTLDTGTYFVEIFNDTTGSTSSFFWETGTLDEIAGIEGAFFDQATPGSTTGGGNYDPESELAIRLAVASPDADCNADGLLDDCFAALTVDLGPDREIAPNRTYDPIAPAMQIIGGNGDLTYHWQIISGPSALGISGPYKMNPSFKPQAEGTYVVRCTVQDSSVGPCVSYDDIVITVAPLDVDLPETLYACVETQTRPLGNIPLAIGGTPPYAYEWQVLEGPSDFDTLPKTHANPTLIPPTDEPYIVQVTVTDSSNPAYVVTKAAQILIEDPPSVDAGEVADYHPIIMIGDTLNLGGAPTATGGHPPYEYGWSIPVNPDNAASISDATAANPTFTATAKGGYVVRVQITDLGGCSAETTFTISVVTDAPSSLVPITPSGPGGLACGMCAPANGATIALLCVGYLALYAGRRSRRRL